jgi:hypothetical protein
MVTKVAGLVICLVKILDDLGWSTKLSGAKAEGDGERGHEKRGGCAFAGDVGDDYINYVVGDLEEVVVVAAEQPRGLHCSGQFEAGNDWRLWQDAPLDLGGQDEIALVLVALPAHLGGEAFALLCDERDEKSDDEKAGEAQCDVGDP